MPVKNIVLNASPFILLCNTELEFILPKLFSKIVIPDAVWQEILAGPSADRAAQLLSTLSWITKKDILPLPEIIRWDLGDGETAVLSFTATNRDYTPVLDDLLAKKCAKSLGIQAIGTGTVLLLAKERGLITSVEQALRNLQEAGLWISEPVIQMLKLQAGE